MSLSPQSAALIARMQAMPKAYRVLTTFVDGTTRHYDVATLGQAENYKVGESRKIGRDLINRDSGATVRVVSVEIVKL